MSSTTQQQMVVSVESIINFTEELLHKAINDMLGYPPNSDIHTEARQWIYEDDGEDPTSFNTVCGVLTLSKEMVRYVLNDQRDRGKRRMLEVEYGRFLDMCRQ